MKCNVLILVLSLLLTTFAAADEDHHNHHHEHHSDSEFDFEETETTLSESTLTSSESTKTSNESTLTSTSNESAEDGDEVLILNNENFNKTLSDHNLLLVEFYAPWCPHCQEFKKEYAKVAAAMKTRAESYGKFVTVAKVDAGVEKALNKRFNVKSIPEIIFFKSSEMYYYNGNWTSEGVLEFIDAKLTAPRVNYIYSPTHAMSLDWNQPMILVGCFETIGSPNEAAFVDLYIEKLPFPIYVSRNKTVFEHYNTSDNNVIAVKHFFDDNGVAAYQGNFTTSELKKWAEDNYYAD